MVDIPEHLLLRSAEARAKALGISVEQALAEMKGEASPTIVSKEPEVQVIEEKPLTQKNQLQLFKKKKLLLLQLFKKKKLLLLQLFKKKKLLQLQLFKKKKMLLLQLFKKKKLHQLLLLKQINLLMLSFHLKLKLLRGY